MCRVGCFVSRCGRADEADNSTTRWADVGTTGGRAGAVTHLRPTEPAGGAVAPLILCSRNRPLTRPPYLLDLPRLCLESGLGGGVDPRPHGEGRASQLHRSRAGHPPRPRRRGCGVRPESRAGVPGGGRRGGDVGERIVADVGPHSEENTISSDGNDTPELGN